MYGVYMEIYVVFRGEPPAEWAEVPGVKAVSADSLASIEGKFVLSSATESWRRGLKSATSRRRKPESS